MNVFFQKQLIIFYLLSGHLLFCNELCAQAIPFEVEDHFEIHNDPAIGIKLMPEAVCTDRSSAENGFVFIRDKVKINTDLPEPPAGTCGDVYTNNYLEFYPKDFTGSGFTISRLGTATYPWSQLHVGRIIASGGIFGQNGSHYTNQIILPAGRNILNEGDNLVDDGVIFSPSAPNSTSDITLWAEDDIVMNYRYQSGQTNGEFRITENVPTNVKFRVATGGDIYMPDLPSTDLFYPTVVIDPTDGHLYYASPLVAKTSSAVDSQLLETVQLIRQENEELKMQLKNLMSVLESQAKEVQNLSQAVSKISQTN